MGSPHHRSVMESVTNYENSTKDLTEMVSTGTESSSVRKFLRYNIEQCLYTDHFPKQNLQKAYSMFDATEVTFDAQIPWFERSSESLIDSGYDSNVPTRDSSPEDFYSKQDDTSIFPQATLDSHLRPFRSPLRLIPGLCDDISAQGFELLSSPTTNTRVRENTPLKHDDESNLLVRKSGGLPPRAQQQQSNPHGSLNSPSHFGAGSPCPIENCERHLSGKRIEQDHIKRVHLGIPEDQFGSSTEASSFSIEEDVEGSQSDTSCSGASSSPEIDTDLLLAHAKHEILVPIMREVYTMLDTGENSAMKQCLQSTSETPSSHATGFKFQPIQKQSTRRNSREKREASDDDDDEGRKRRRKRPRRSPSREVKDDKQRDFACPFHKYDSFKYCATSIDGSRYRSCVGPGFKSISRVKYVY